MLDDRMNKMLKKIHSRLIIIQGILEAEVQILKEVQCSSLIIIHAKV